MQNRITLDTIAISEAPKPHIHYIKDIGVLLVYVDRLASEGKIGKEVGDKMKKGITKSNNKNPNEEVELVIVRDGLIAKLNQEGNSLSESRLEQLRLELMPSKAVKELELLPQIIELEKSLRRKGIIKPSTFDVYRRRLPSRALHILSSIQKKHDARLAELMSGKIKSSGRLPWVKIVNDGVQIAKDIDTNDLLSTDLE